MMKHFSGIIINGSCNRAANENNNNNKNNNSSRFTVLHHTLMLSTNQKILKTTKSKTSPEVKKTLKCTHMMLLALILLVTSFIIPYIDAQEIDDSNYDVETLNETSLTGQITIDTANDFSQIKYNSELKEAESVELSSSGLLTNSEESQNPDAKDESGMDPNLINDNNEHEKTELSSQIGVNVNKTFDGTFNKTSITGQIMNDVANEVLHTFSQIGVNIEPKSSSTSNEIITNITEVLPKNGNTNGSTQESLSNSLDIISADIINTEEEKSHSEENKEDREIDVQKSTGKENEEKWQEKQEYSSTSPKISTKIIEALSENGNTNGSTISDAIVLSMDENHPQNNSLEDIPNKERVSKMILSDKTNRNNNYNEESELDKNKNTSTEEDKNQSEENKEDIEKEVQISTEKGNEGDRQAQPEILSNPTTTEPSSTPTENIPSITEALFENSETDNSTEESLSNSQDEKVNEDDRQVQPEIRHNPTTTEPSPSSTESIPNITEAIFENGETDSSTADPVPSQDNSIPDPSRNSLENISNTESDSTTTLSYESVGEAINRTNVNNNYGDYDDDVVADKENESTQEPQEILSYSTNIEPSSTTTKSSLTTTEDVFENANTKVSTADNSITEAASTSMESSNPPNNSRENILTAQSHSSTSFSNKSVFFIGFCSGIAVLFVLVSITILVVSFRRQQGILDIEKQEKKCGKDNLQEEDAETHTKLLSIDLPVPTIVTALTSTETTDETL